LPHRLSSTDGDPEPEGPTSLEGSADGGLGMVREGAGELSGVVAVRGASGPWGRPLGSMEIGVVRRIIGDPTGSTTTEIW
jgi:hypothetical protein